MLIAAVLVNACSFTAFAILALLHNYFIDSAEDINVKLAFSFSDNIATSRTVYTIIICFFTVIGGVIIFLDGNLVSFHVYIISKGLSTYQYIINIREKVRFV